MVKRENNMSQKVTILGSTGSIGSSTLKIIKNDPQSFKVFAISAEKNLEKIFCQCLEFRPKYAVLSSKVLSETLKKKILASGLKTRVLFGQEGLCEVSKNKLVDIIVVAIVGFAALVPFYQAVLKGKKILLANKEVIVVAGNIMMSLAKKYKAEIIPLDSEHNAIFQLLQTPHKKENIDKIILTASGGPFLKTKLNEIHSVTPEEACSHPIWEMGKKISIDSSTMVNKALELVEAYWLFSLPINLLSILIHPEGFIHSIIRYTDGNSFALIANHDMSIPISYSLYYPERKKQTTIT